MAERHGAEPVLDVLAVLAAMQAQLDDLTAAVEAQQRTLDELATRLPGRDTRSGDR